MSVLNLKWSLTYLGSSYNLRPGQSPGYISATKLCWAATATAWSSLRSWGVGLCTTLSEVPLKIAVLAYSSQPNSECVAGSCQVIQFVLPTDMQQMCKYDDVQTKLCAFLIVCLQALMSCFAQHIAYSQPCHLTCSSHV